MIVSGYVAAHTLTFYYTVLYTLKCVQQWKLRSAMVKEYGCAKPAAQRPCDILGLSNIYSSVKHLYRETLLEDISTSFRQYGDAYASGISNQRVYFTRDPCNIRHILLTQFADFNTPTSALTSSAL
ncbi:hypothetical protein BDW69DRAFT_181682 [Aspergillus filifer]